jgi:hypothetical protein
LAVAVASCSGSIVGDPAGVTGAELGPPELQVVVLAGDDLSVIPASVSIDGVRVPVSNGLAVVAWPERSIEIGVTAPGFRSWTQELTTYPDAGRIEFRLDPVVLSGRVTTPDGLSLPDAVVVLGSRENRTDEEGYFRIERAAPGEIVITRPAWQETRVPWDGATEGIDLTMEPLRVRALRVSAEAAGDAARWNEVLSLADISAIDAVVVDVKDETGTVGHDTEVEKAHQIGAAKVWYDIDDVVADMREHGLYSIARIVTFQDTPLATAEPEHAVAREDGGPWESDAGHRWLDPSDPASYEYALDLAEEACRSGFDEVQFDYVSYPFGGPVSDATFDAEYTEEVRVASISAFLDRAYRSLSALDCAVGASILAITLESHTDEGVGQRPGAMSRTIDVLSPMLYTTNYGAGWKGLADPNAHAVEVVEGALGTGVRKLEGFGYYRPWLQTWTISEADVRDVQRSVEAFGVGWMLWSTSSSYSASVLPTR